MGSGGCADDRDGPCAGTGGRPARGSFDTAKVAIARRCGPVAGKRQLEQLVRWRFHLAREHQRVHQGTCQLTA